MSDETDDETCDSCFGQTCQFCCGREHHDYCFCHCTPRDTDTLVMGPPLKTEAELRAGWLAELGSDENVERVARALHESHQKMLLDAGNDDWETWDGEMKIIKAQYRDDVRAVLGALTGGQTK